MQYRRSTAQNFSLAMALVMTGHDHKDSENGNGPSIVYGVVGLQPVAIGGVDHLELVKSMYIP